MKNKFISTILSLAFLSGIAGCHNESMTKTDSPKIEKAASEVLDTSIVSKKCLHQIHDLKQVIQNQLIEPVISIIVYPYETRVTDYEKYGSQIGDYLVHILKNEIENSKSSEEKKGILELLKVYDFVNEGDIFHTTKDCLPGIQKAFGKAYVPYTSISYNESGVGIVQLNYKSNKEDDSFSPNQTKINYLEFAKLLYGYINDYIEKGTWDGLGENMQRIFKHQIENEEKPIDENLFLEENHYQLVEIIKSRREYAQKEMFDFCMKNTADSAKHEKLKSINICKN